MSTNSSTASGSLALSATCLERGFRVLKSEIEIGPIYHRLPERIHAHASICFMALILYRVMRSRLNDSHSQISPERALDKLRRIQHQVVTVNDLEPVAALSNINQEHTAILQALTIKKPTLQQFYEHTRQANVSGCSRSKTSFAHSITTISSSPTLVMSCVPKNKVKNKVGVFLVGVLFKVPFLKSQRHFTPRQPA